MTKIMIDRELLERAATLLQDSLNPPAGCTDFDDWSAQGDALAEQLRAILAQPALAADAELEQYLSAGIAQIEAERDKLRAELAAEIQKRWDGNEQSSREHREEIDQLRAELAALKTQQVEQEGGKV